MFPFEAFLDDEVTAESAIKCSMLDDGPSAVLMEEVCTNMGPRVEYGRTL